MEHSESVKRFCSEIIIINQTVIGVRGFKWCIHNVVIFVALLAFDCISFFVFFLFDVLCLQMCSRHVKRFCSVLIIENRTVIGIRGDSSDVVNVVIPAGVLHIGDTAFHGKRLTSVTLPDSLISVGHRAFASCKGIASVTLPDSLTSVGYSVFESCTALTSVTIPNALTSIGDGAFMRTAIVSVTLPDSLTHVCPYVFSYCKALTFLTLPDSLISVGDRAFFMCTTLPSLTLPDSVNSVGDSAFAFCKSITSLKLPESLTRLGVRAFECCLALTSVTLPDSLTAVPDYAFSSCVTLTSLTLPDSVTSVGDHAFEVCESLTSLTLPDSLTNVGISSFGDCTGLTSVTFRPPVSRGAFITWAIGSSRNRGNWQITTLKHSHNVLRLITTFALHRRDVSSIRSITKVFPDCRRLGETLGIPELQTTEFHDRYPDVVFPPP